MNLARACRVMGRTPNDERSDAMSPNNPAHAATKANRERQISGGETPKAAATPPADPKRIADLESHVAEIEKIVGRPFGIAFYSLSDRVKKLEDNERRVDYLEGRVGTPFGSTFHSLSDRVKKLEDNERRRGY